MNSRGFIFAFCCLSFCHFSVAAKATEQQVSTKIEMFRNGVSVGAANLPAIKVQIEATKIARDDVTGKVMLTGDCAVLLVQDDEHSLRFEGDFATVESPIIEVQVNGGYGIDAPDFPYRQLYGALQATPELSLFRLRWDFSMGSFVTSGTALYNRETRQLKTYEARSKSYGLFTGVTEKMFSQEAAREKEWHTTSGTTWPLDWHSLTDYGAVEEQVSPAAQAN